MSNIDYLDMAISTCFSLRKIKNIIIEEEKSPFRLRPQNHLLIVSPFGTFKSSITQQLRRKNPDDIFVNDDFTKPSVEGSISKDGDYVPSILIHVGGKIFVIDEWNSIGIFGQNSMLSLLENQESSRSLGFKVKTPYNFKDKYGFVNFDVKENMIKVKATFSCIAYAMEYPIYENSQKAKALLSRFSPLFIQPTKEYIKQGSCGDFETNIEDYATPINTIVIPKQIHKEFWTKYYEYIDKNNLWPDDTCDYGFIPRTMSEITRYGIFNYLKANRPKPKIKEMQIDDASYFEQAFDFIETILSQFTNPNTKSKVIQYKEIKERHPTFNKTQLARLMGVSTQTISSYEEKIQSQHLPFRLTK